MSATLTCSGQLTPPPPDLVRLRRDRELRVRRAMDAQGVDAMILLGSANVSYLTGATWPLGEAGRGTVERPVAVIVADDPQPHLFTPFLAEAADQLDLDDDHLHGPTYLDAVEGLDRFAASLANLIPFAATVAIDEVTAAMHLVPDAVPTTWPPHSAGEVMRAARLTKTPDELASIRRALWIAEEAMAEVVAELTPGARPTDLSAAFVHRVVALGADADVLTTPTTQDVVGITSTRPEGRPCGHGRLAAGDLIAIDAGVIADGYAGAVGRTWPVGVPQDACRMDDLQRRWPDLWGRLLDACRPGAPASGLLDAYRAAGEPLPVMPIARGLGLGFDDPVVVRDLPDTAARVRLDPGVVLSITGCVFDGDLGSVIAHEAVAITTTGAEVLSRSPFWTREQAGALS